MVGRYQSSTAARWDFLLKGIYSVEALTCGDFTSHKGDELIVWQPQKGGSYLLGEFDGSFRRTAWDYLTPSGLSQPFEGEIVSGDIDGDGKDELLVNEFRPKTGDHAIMVADFTSSRRFRWYSYLEGVSAPAYRPATLTKCSFAGQARSVDI